MIRSGEEAEGGGGPTVRGEAAAIDRSRAPVTPDDILTALRQVGVVAGGVIMVHSSLSRLGWVVGGVQSVVESLVAGVGDTGTIVMPAHTGISDPSTWVDPPVPEAWWPTIRRHWPAFDADLTPLRGMGTVVETFRRLPGVIHSGHPAVAVVARGPEAAPIAGHHRLADGLGDGSPLGRLYQADARVVLIGVGHGNNTALHLAEHRAAGPDAATVAMAAPLLVDGERQWVSYDDLDRASDDFPALGQAFVAAGGVERSAPLGAGGVTSHRMRDIVDFGVDWLTTNRS